MLVAPCLQRRTGSGVYVLSEEGYLHASRELSWAVPPEATGKAGAPSSLEAKASVVSPVSISAYW
jgi:hypothetical protein